MGHMSDLLSAAGHAGFVQHAIDLLVPHKAIRFFPRRLEGAVGVRTTIGAGTMAGGKSDGFIKEE